MERMLAGWLASRLSAIHACFSGNILDIFRLHSWSSLSTDFSALVRFSTMWDLS